MQQSEQAEAEAAGEGGEAEAQAGGWTADQFKAWKGRMGLKAHKETGAALGISDETARSYGKGRKAVPPYIVRLCEALEKLQGAAVSAGASDLVMCQKLAQAYADQVKRNRPLAGLTMDVPGIAVMLEAALAQLGLCLAREEEVEG